ncbi:hypothetical protein DFJ73DRAFT_498925 [Zopfochytrium polystomum]|nr:hypothetical protein DFJ73DRAFT_498925 [Zopfochytrium polystomum]
MNYAIMGGAPPPSAARSGSNSGSSGGRPTPIARGGGGGGTPYFPGRRNQAVFVEFLVSRPTLDLPPFEIQLVQPPPAVAQTRTIDGVVRITIDPSPNGQPLLAEKLVLRFRGGRAGAHETLLKLLLWQPSSKEEFERGLLPGRHDFPFALDIPSSLHASAEGAKVPQISAGPAGVPSDHFRTYEMTASLNSFVNNNVVEDEASKPVIVRRCYPLPWFYPEAPSQRTIGTTTPGGELAYRVIAPKVWNIADKREFDVDVVLDDGSETTSRITAIECCLMQRLRHRDAPIMGLQVPVENVPATVASPVGPALKLRPPPINLGTTSMRLSFGFPNVAIQPDAELDPFLLEHTLQFTVSIARMMMTKKASFSVPIRMVIPADADDRVLNSIPPPMQWMVTKEALGAPNSSHSGGSTKRVEKVSKSDLSALLSLGVATSPAESRKTGSSGKGSAQLARRPSGSSQGSGGGRLRSQEGLVSGMDSLVLSGTGSSLSGQKPHSPTVFSTGANSTSTGSRSHHHALGSRVRRIQSPSRHYEP